MAERPWISSRTRKTRRAGFTLLELLTALAVLGVAATIFLRLFSSSYSLADTSRSHEVALNLAEEYLAAIQSNPERFAWPDLEDTAAGGAVKLSWISPFSMGLIGFTLPEAVSSRSGHANRSGLD